MTLKNNKTRMEKWEEAIINTKSYILMTKVKEEMILTKRKEYAVDKPSLYKMNSMALIQASINQF